METTNHSILNSIGNTPLVKIGKVYAKNEALNPSGSMKDRIALGMIEAAERAGDLRPGCTIVEPSSGNTGISMAMVGRAKGYRVTIVMPEHMSLERQKMMKALGAELVLTPKEGNMAAAVKKAAEIARQENTCMPNQYSNPANTKAQEKMGQEILDEIGPADAVIAGYGTGGVLMGIANVMRRANPKCRVIAVEPEEAPLLSKKNAVIRPHTIQGIGVGFVPDLLDKSMIDEVITVSSEQAMKRTRQLCRENGLMVGISSGANVLAAEKLAEKYEKVVTVLPDRAERYLSMDLY